MRGVATPAAYVAAPIINVRPVSVKKLLKNSLHDADEICKHTSIVALILMKNFFTLFLREIKIWKIYLRMIFLLVYKKSIKIK